MTKPPLLLRAAARANQLKRQCLDSYHKVFPKAKLQSAKAHWRDKRNECRIGQILFDTLSQSEREDMRRILEFGCNWGGNLGFFLEKLNQATCLGIDINPVAHELEAVFPSRYEGRTGDENALTSLQDRSFDLAFTSSVLDHIPSRPVVVDVIKHLTRISSVVFLLEPWVEGIEGDVSGKQRAQVRKDLPNPYKVFADHSYLWNYDEILNDLGLTWQKTPQPLHAASLGPFYHLYRIEGRSGKGARLP
ncbi:MAG: class I SAM-dependent methyltransferase [Rhodospirillales bacterium]|nr:MAG: class I SAM-dependent methyltransferase [Rhodospirillales bacterium]